MKKSQLEFKQNGKHSSQVNQKKQQKQKNTKKELVELKKKMKRMEKEVKNLEKECEQKVMDDFFFHSNYFNRSLHVIII
jgi:molecular chaperone GrpE (heat shock protein)